MRVIEMKKIEKWKTEDDEELITWGENLAETLRHGSIYKNPDDVLPLHLSINIFGDDDIHVHSDGKEVQIEVDEETHDATDMRDQNIEFIKLYIDKYLPYLKYKEMKEPYDSECGFRLVYSVKERA